MLNLLLKWTHIEGACTWYLVMVENVEFLTSWKLRRRKGAYFKCRWCTKWILEVKLWLSRSCANAVGVKRHEQNRSCLTLFMCCLTCSFNALIKLLWLLCKYQFCGTVYSSHSSFFLYSSQIVQDPAHKLLNSLRVCLLCTWSFFHLFNYCFFFFYFNGTCWTYIIQGVDSDQHSEKMCNGVVCQVGLSLYTNTSH